MGSGLQVSHADRLIAESYLSSCQSVRAALQWMGRRGQFTTSKPVRYWSLVLRNLWRIRLIELASQESEVETDETQTQTLPHRDTCYVTLVPESPHAIKSVIYFLLVTLRLSFVGLKGIGAYSADAPTGERSEASWQEGVRIAARSGTISITLSKSSRRLVLLTLASRFSITNYTLSSGLSIYSHDSPDLHHTHFIQQPLRFNGREVSPWWLSLLMQDPQLKLDSVG